MIQFGDEQPKVTLQFDEDARETPGANIKVIGVGGGGGNAVDRMIAAGVGGVDFLVANTDAQALRRSQAPTKIHIGAKVTKGLGAGAKPEIGREAALEDTNSIIEHLEGADMVFVTAGLGGGTGTGAAPIIASLASELNALVVAVVTTPFSFEGPRRRRNSEGGLKELKSCVDTVITISNDKLLSTVPAQTPFTEAFRIADDVLRQAVQGISDLINVPGIINLDFADVKTIMEGMGVALMGSGTASGENRAVDAAQAAISSPLLEDASINGARGVLLNIIGGPDLTMTEINEAASLIHQACDPDAEIIFGAVTDESMTGSVSVTVIATGFSTPSRELAEQEDDNVVTYVPKQDEKSQPPENNSQFARPQRPEPESRDQRVSQSRTSGAGREPEDMPTGGHGSRLTNRPSREAFGERAESTRRFEAEPRHADGPSRRMESRRLDGPSRRMDSRASRGYDGDSESYESTPAESLPEVLMSPQPYGANNMGFEDENDLDIPTYLRNMRKMKK